MRQIAAVLMLLMTAGAVQAQQLRISDRVFVVPDKPGTSMRFEMIVNAGAHDEANGEVKGIAHYLEHLILVGRNPEHTQTAMRMFADGSANGWTSDRATAYLHTVPPRANGHAAELERLFGVYAARLKDFTVTDADAARERNVVVQEFDQRNSTPSSRFYRQISGQLIPDHPAGQSISGSRESIAAMTIEDARAFHRTWYVPNNVWFVVRTSLEPEVVKSIADRALAGLAPSPLPIRNREQPVSTDGSPPSIRMEHEDVARPVVVARRIASGGPTEMLKADALVTLLGAYLSSRFSGSGHDVLVEQDRVAADDVSVLLQRIAPQTFVLSVAGSVAANREPAELEAAMVRYLDRIAQHGLPNEAQLTRLKTRVADQFRRASGEPSVAHGRLVGWLAAGRDPEQLAQWPELINSITLADLRSFATIFNGRTKQIIGQLQPKDGAP